MRHTAVGVGAAGHVGPKALHVGAVVGDGTGAVLVGALGRVVEEQEALLLVPGAEFVVPRRRAAAPSSAVAVRRGGSMRRLRMIPTRGGGVDGHHAAAAAAAAAIHHGVDIIHVDNAAHLPGWLLLLLRVLSPLLLVLLLPR